MQSNQHSVARMRDNESGIIGLQQVEMSSTNSEAILKAKQV
jgi:hypothetical protein